MATFHDGQGLVLGKREKQWAIPNPVVNRFPDTEILIFQQIHPQNSWKKRISQILQSKCHLPDCIRDLKMGRIHRATLFIPTTFHNSGFWHY
jgi:hypothetical protein